MEDQRRGSQASSSADTLFTRPPEWTDQDRMHFLLAPFPLDTSPSPQDPKLSFWASLIISSSKELKSPCFTEEELRSRFKWNQTLSPSCLGTVIENMEKSGVVTKRTEFEQSSRKLGWLAWSVKVVSKPVSWALSSYLSSAKYTGQYFITSLVKEYADQVIAQHRKGVLYKSTDLVMTLSDFDAVSSQVVSEDLLPLVKVALLRDCRIAIQSTEYAPTESGFDVVKICNGRATAVSDMDVGIVRIKEAVKRLREQVDSLTTRIHELRQSAKENIRNKRRALRLLRQSKVLEATLEKREMGLENLQTALHQIQTAETDVMIFEAYKSGASALKAVRESQGLTLDRAEEAVDELKEAVEESEEISGILSAGGRDVESDQDELERELAALLEPEQQQAGNTGPPTDMREKSGSDIEKELEAQLASLSIHNHTGQVGEDKTKVKSKQKQTPLLA